MEMEQRIQTLNKLLGGGADEDILTFTLAKAEDMILHYCKLSTLPVGLENILLGMSVDLYRSEQLGAETATGAVKSITEGGVSVSFGSGAAVSENPAMAFLKNYEEQLKRYRKVGW